MSRLDFSVYIGETWNIDGTVNDEKGQSVDLTGGSIEFRIASKTALVVKLVSPSDITIDPDVVGAYQIQLDADASAQAGLEAGEYRYEIDAITADGAVSVQNDGRVTLLKSLRRAFP